MGVLDALGIERAHIIGSVDGRLDRGPDGGALAGTHRVGDHHRRHALRLSAPVASGCARVPRRRWSWTARWTWRPTASSACRRSCTRRPSPTRSPDPLAHEVLIDALQTTAVLARDDPGAGRRLALPHRLGPVDRPDRPVPALVMAGSLDEPTFQSFARDAEELPRATGSIVEGSAHLANISHAALVNALILEHLAATGLGTRMAERPTPPLFVDAATVERHLPDAASAPSRSPRSCWAPSAAPRHRPAKASLPPGAAGTFAQVMAARLDAGDAPDDRPLLGMKWIAGNAGNRARGLPAMGSLVVLNDPDSGLPVAILDGSPITACRTAALSGAAIRILEPSGRHAPDRPRAGRRRPGSGAPRRARRVWRDHGLGPRPSPRPEPRPGCRMPRVRRPARRGSGRPDRPHAGRPTSS